MSVTPRFKFHACTSSGSRDIAVQNVVTKENKNKKRQKKEMMAVAICPFSYGMGHNKTKHQKCNPRDKQFKIILGLTKNVCTIQNFLSFKNHNYAHAYRLHYN